LTDNAPSDSYHGQIRRDMIALVPKGARLLDLGGGYGATALELKRLGKCTYAGLIDLAAPEHVEGLDVTRRDNLAEPGVLERFVAEQGQFDTILCLDILEHLAEPEALLDAVRGALRPGGHLVASIPNVRHCSVIMPLLLRGQWDYRESGVLDRTHLRFFTRSSIRALIEGAGFQIKRMVPSATASRWQRLGNALTLGLLRDLFTMQYFVVAQNRDEP
jgi:2-polyprenyl-3-methyl-5-hydroxy-6-metoxy-1,4-benzoquinol methylase